LENVSKPVQIRTNPEKRLSKAGNSLGQACRPARRQSAAPPQIGRRKKFSAHLKKTFDKPAWAFIMRGSFAARP
jgi:hypothetical protein